MVLNNDLEKYVVFNGSVTVIMCGKFRYCTGSVLYF
jgi:hypothetical protein